MRLSSIVMALVLAFIISCPVFADKTVDVYWTKFTIPDGFERAPKDPSTFTNEKDKSSIVLVTGGKYHPLKSMYWLMKYDRKESQKSLVSECINNKKEEFKKQNMSYKFISDSDFDVNGQPGLKMKGRLSGKKEKPVIELMYLCVYKGSPIMITAKCPEKSVGKYEKIFDGVVRSIVVDNNMITQYAVSKTLKPAKTKGGWSFKLPDNFDGNFDGDDQYTFFKSETDFVTVIIEDSKPNDPNAEVMKQVEDGLRKKDPNMRKLFIDGMKHVAREDNHKYISDADFNVGNIKGLKFKTAGSIKRGMIEDKDCIQVCYSFLYKGKNFVIQAYCPKNVFSKYEKMLDGIAKSVAVKK